MDEDRPGTTTSTSTGGAANDRTNGRPATGCVRGPRHPPIERLSLSLSCQQRHGDGTVRIDDSPERLRSPYRAVPVAGRRLRGLFLPRVRPIPHRTLAHTIVPGNGGHKTLYADSACMRGAPR